jgi:hypothetical protein
LTEKRALKEFPSPSFKSEGRRGGIRDIPLSPFALTPTPTVVHDVYISSSRERLSLAKAITAMWL